MVVNASVECKFSCRNKAIKRHSSLHLFQVLCGSSSCCSSAWTASPLHEWRTHPLMIRSEGITLSGQPIKLISKDTALKRPREIKLWLGISPVSLLAGNLYKHLNIQPTKIWTNFFFNWGRWSRGPALNTTMCNLITYRWESQLYHLSRGNLAVAIVIFNILPLWATDKNS